MALFAQGHQGKKGPARSVPITATAITDRQKIIIGEPVQLMLEVSVPDNLPLTWPVLDSLPHFEWIEKGHVDSTLQNGIRHYRQYLTLTSFDSGAWAIPRLPFTSGNKQYLSDSVRILVGYTSAAPVKDYHDIKDIIDVPNPFAKWFVWIIVAVTLGSLALVVWFIRKKKLLKQLIPSLNRSPLTPYEEALKQLDLLEKQELPAKGSVKIYYIRLSEIFREYLFREWEISSLAETSEELIGQLRRLPFSAEQHTALAGMLRISDFVKFAKYQPSLADSEQHCRTIRKSMELLNEQRLAEVAAAKAQASNPGSAVSDKESSANGPQRQSNNQTKQ